MKMASLDCFRALAVISLLAGCGSDEGITSLPPPDVDAAAPVVTPDAARPTPDVAVATPDGATSDALADAAGSDASDDGGVDVAADTAPDAEPDARTCGGMGQTACPGFQCADGLCLSDMNKCIGPGMPCGQMSGNCNANGTCGAGAQTCGGENQECCGIGQPPEGAFCSKPGTACVGNGMNRSCRACGDKGQPCCGDPGSCTWGTCMGNGNNRTCQ